MGSVAEETTEAGTTEEEKTPTQAPWAFDVNEVLEAQDSTEDGLGSEEAQHRLSDRGRNELPATQATPVWKRFLSHFDDVLIYILLAAAVLKALTEDWVDFTVIIIVAVANAIIGFIQEGRSQNALASLRNIMSLESEVRRGGSWSTVDAAELVPGDIVKVSSGDRVPADLRLISASSLKADEAALTGESEPTDKDTNAVAADAGVGDRSSMLFSSTIITAGNGVGVVVATGSDTEIGQISSLVSEMEQVETPLAKQLAQLAKTLSIAIGGMAAIMLLVGRLAHNYELEELISAAIGFAVAAIPEGLPALVTITLALGVQQMAKRKAITRKMASVETLGSVTVICSDKTGTLTQNEMTARSVVTATGAYDVSGSGYEPIGEITDADDNTIDLGELPELSALIWAVGISNDARVEETEQGWRVIGQPTEGALDVLAVKAGIDIDSAERKSQIPFSSDHKFSATYDVMADGEEFVHVVGAPDRLLDRSSEELTADGSTTSLDREAWDKRIDELSAQGLRVLAAARREATDSDNDLQLEAVEDGLVFLGLIGIVDPPRPEVRDAIAEAHSAGIRVKMITGDHAGTAVAIARELGIVPENGEVKALTGGELERMSQEELRKCVRDVDVYARTSPEHKLRIVRALQSHNEIVAMTGDGVNDAPSITRADVGIAMGIKGTEATKEAADIVLADDNFTSIERAVEEGRRIYDNIRKSVVFLLPTNGAQSLVILVAVLLGLSLPLSPVQILWVNLITAVTLSLTLVGEPAEPGIMKRPPRSPKEKVLSGPALIMVALVSFLIGGATLAVYLMERELSDSYAMAQTTAVTMLVLGQLAFLFNCRFLNSSSFTWRVFTGNRVLWYSIGILIGTQMLFIYAPFMNNWFGSTPIGLREWGLTFAAAVVVFILAEVGKQFAHRAADRRRAAKAAA